MFIFSSFVSLLLEEGKVRLVLLSRLIVFLCLMLHVTLEGCLPEGTIAAALLMEVAEEDSSESDLLVIS